MSLICTTLNQTQFGCQIWNICCDNYQLNNWNRENVVNRTQLMAVKQNIIQLPNVILMHISTISTVTRIFSHFVASRYGRFGTTLDRSEIFFISDSVYFCSPSHSDLLWAHQIWGPTFVPLIAKNDQITGHISNP